MDELNTLDLLKSLTLGVNNKITQEQDSEIEYIVDTSLSNKRKKSAPPIIKEVVKEKESNDNILLDDEVFYESEIIEESFDIVVEEEHLDIVEEESFDVVEEESFAMIIEDEPLETIVEDEVFIEESGENFFIEDEVLNKNNTVDIEDSGHISEEFVEEKKKDKIQRNGNPFKRGPRKKKEKVQKVIKPLETETFDDVEVIEESIVEIAEEVVTDTYLDELHSLDDSEFDTLFSDFEEEDLIEDSSEPILEEEIFEVEVEPEIVEEVEETFDNVEGISDDTFEETSDDISNDTTDDSFAEEHLDIDVKEENVEEEQKEQSNDLDFLNSFEKKEKTPVIKNVKVEAKKEEITENTEDSKFKDCIYYKGMSVEEFLRQNPNYREALYVEHFFAKEELNKLIVSGLLLIKKGKYRL